MNVLKLFILVAVLAIAVPAFSQSDSSAVRVDSVVKKTVAPSVKPKSVTKAAAKGASKDTSLSKQNKQNQGKSKVVKDSARLALEALPGKAAWSSAIIPGWGQIRNKRWWKVPFIYGGLVSVGLAFEFNQRYYSDILKELQYREFHNQDHKNPKYDIYGREQLISAKDFYRRSRDLSILGFLAIHTINIVDAYVDAKFFRYDISDKLGFNIQPTLLPSTSFALAQPVPALKLTIPL